MIDEVVPPKKGTGAAAVMGGAREEKNENDDEEPLDEDDSEDFNRLAAGGCSDRSESDNSPISSPISNHSSVATSAKQGDKKQADNQCSDERASRTRQNVNIRLAVNSKLGNRPRGNDPIGHDFHSRHFVKKPAVSDLGGGRVVEVDVDAAVVPPPLPPPPPPPLPAPPTLPLLMKTEDDNPVDGKRMDCAAVCKSTSEIKRADSCSADAVAIANSTGVNRLSGGGEAEGEIGTREVGVAVVVEVAEGLVGVAVVEVFVGGVEDGRDGGWWWCGCCKAEDCARKLNSPRCSLVSSN